MLPTRRSLWLLILLLAAPAGFADALTETLLSRALPPRPVPIERFGENLAIVFTPDLSVKNNCNFYEALGFVCFDTADWRQVIRGIESHNRSNHERPIRTLILETHGTNGHGLKLQKGKRQSDERSYISVGALQEMLEPAGVTHIIISACNSGRLLRPEIYLRLNRDPGDRLFLPPTLGIVDASERFDPASSRVTVITPENSQIETTLLGSLSEFTPDTRRALARAAARRGINVPRQFAISELLIQMLLRDPDLRLRTGAWVEELSNQQTTPDGSERLFHSFLRHIETVVVQDTSRNLVAAGAD
jgi:hypothetical protein